MMSYAKIALEFTITGDMLRQHLSEKVKREIEARGADYDELACKLSVTPECIRKTERKALMKLKRQRPDAIEILLHYNELQGTQTLWEKMEDMI